ncbi:hypothetical protein B0H11DRAFT_2055821 [Mycena galericulata]|nr:hypothetical protein B0H11DRAFT_2055821 [Mycena galericulata]
MVRAFEDPSYPLRKCGCSCLAACRCTCPCRQHCTCKAACTGNCAHVTSRNLVVSIDGAFYRLGSRNTNVAQLHSRVLIDQAQTQLTYYDCGNGTYTSNRGGSFKCWLQRLAGDLGFAWNSKKIIVEAYRWLCEQYRPGDKIFLFGFSRGAYEVLTLSAMIEKVGLVNAGNQGLILIAYQVFRETQEHKSETAQNFENTFSRRVNVHFVGVWGTVGGKPDIWPSSVEHVCTVRHALALDEPKADFLSAYESTSNPLCAFAQSSTKEKDESASMETKISTPKKTLAGVGKGASKFLHTVGQTIDSSNTQVSGRKAGPKDIKEVWFAGTHADIGGDSQATALSRTVLLWMEIQASSAGLHLRSRTSADNWNSEAFRQDTENTSLPRFLTTLPIKRLSRIPHVIFRAPCIGNGPCRLISEQLIHASVAFASKKYRPRATLLRDGVDWQLVVGQSFEHTDFDWATRSVTGNRLEMDLFDPSSVMDAVRNLSAMWNRGEHETDLESRWIKCLSFTALSGNLAATYLSTSTPIWDNDSEVEVGCAVAFVRNLADRQPSIFNGDLAEILEAQGRLLHLHGKGDPERILEEALRIRRVVASELPGTSSRIYKLAAALYWNASYALVRHKSRKALCFLEEAFHILRPLLAEEYLPAFPLFAALRRNFGSGLKDLGDKTDLDQVLRVAETSVALSRSLALAYPQYNSLLAAALYDLAFGFRQGPSLQEPHAAEESINLYRKLAHENPDAYSTLFSDAQYNYSRHLFAAGQHKEALCVSLEEAQVRRKLQDKNCLATSLDHLSICLRAAGRLDEALKTAEQSVRIRRNLADLKRSWQSESHLADSLSNLSSCLSLATGQSQHALHAAQEAVSIQRGLSRHVSAETFKQRLAVVLFNFSVCLSAVGRHGEALRAAEEVMQIRATWGDDDVDCALALSRLAVCLGSVGRHEEEQKVASACLELTCRLVAPGERDSRARVEFSTQLAETLLALSFCFAAEHASQSHAIDAAADSVAIYRTLGSPAYDTNLAAGLLQLSALLSASGKNQEALRVAVEAVQFGGGLAKERFTDSLYQLSVCFYNLGRYDEGMGPAQRCVALRQELVHEYGTWQFKQQLADSLFNLSSFFSDSGSDALRALQAVQEGVMIQRDISPYIPAHKFDQRLADGLQNLAARALRAGRYQEALCSVEEAVAITRKLLDSSPSLYTPNLINILYTYANILCEQARYEEAYQAVTETDGLRQTICTDSVFTSVEASAVYMSTRARCVIGLGRDEDGLFCLLDATKLYKGAFAPNLSHDSTFESFPWFLKNVFACVSALRGIYGEEMLDVATKVVELSRLLAGFSSYKFDHSFKEAVEFYTIWQWSESNHLSSAESLNMPC